MRIGRMGGNRTENVVRCNYVRNMRSSAFCAERHRPSINLEKLLRQTACPMRRTVPSRKKSRNRISWFCHVELWIHTGRAVFNQPRPSDISYTRSATLLGSVLSQRASRREKIVISTFRPAEKWIFLVSPALAFSRKTRTP